MSPRYTAAEMLQQAVYCEQGCNVNPGLGVVSAPMLRQAAETEATRAQDLARIAALESVLREAKREHLWEEEDKCDKLNKLDPAEKVCTCGADAWNARIDALLQNTTKETT